MNGSITILGIESSCDETSAAVCRDGEILSNHIAGQAVHQQYGGVVPELASRAHMQHIVPVIDAALKDANTSLDSIDAIAFTQSPGLIGSLLIGGQFAKSLSLALNKPLIAVQHMQAHVVANLIKKPGPDFPFLCLTVSGGHTQIVLCESPLKMRVIGETIDDAAGEAFDKSAKMLGLPYPGGPLIDAYAKKGDPRRFAFPEPKMPGLDFSFSGLKTSILYFLQNAGQSHQFRENNTVTEAEREAFIKNNLEDLCASIQARIISILLSKLQKAVKQTGIIDVCIAGGVSANSGLRKGFESIGREQGWKTFIPEFQYCTDNAAMIAMTGYFKFRAGQLDDLDIKSSARSVMPST
jgi:N6-L-threonylcarbamoyladenine synthase